MTFGKHYSIINIGARIYLKTISYKLSQKFFLHKQHSSDPEKKPFPAEDIRDGCVIRVEFDVGSLGTTPTQLPKTHLQKYNDIFRHFFIGQMNPQHHKILKRFLS